MYTLVTIRWIDDGSEMTVWIKATADEDQQHDEQIFFYGLSTGDCRTICKKQIVCEGEWTIKEVLEVCDSLE